MDTVLTSKEELTGSLKYKTLSLGLKVESLMQINSFSPLIVAHLSMSKVLPLSFFFNDIACHDECLIAASLRKDTDLVVSDDGRSIIVSSTPSEEDQRTIYIEKSSVNIKYETICNLFKDILSVYVGKISDFAFVVFKTSLAYEKAVSKFEYPILKCDTNIAQFIYAEKNYKCGFRIMSKMEWNKRTIEYLQLQQKTLETLHESRVSKGDNVAAFVDGVVCKFAGIHADSPLKIIKRLFEMVAPVSFIDLEPLFDDSVF
jgi:hypothetical protein